MRYISFLIVNIISVVLATAQSKSLVIDKDGINTLFDVSPSKNYIIYGKNLKGFDSGDYIEGQVFIFNRLTNSSELLNKDTLEISSTFFKWGKNDNTLFFSDGKIIYYISIDNEIVVKPIYIPESEYMHIDNFFISNSDKKIACWISNNNPNDATKNLVIIDLESISHKTIYSVKNEWLPESVKSVAAWINDDSIVYINMYGDLFHSNLLKEKIVHLRDSVKTDFLKVKDDFVFYSSNNKLLLYNLKDQHEKVILESTNLNINYLTVNIDNSMVLSFNDKLMYYDGDKAITNVLHTSDLNAKIVYCDSKLFIEEVVNNSKKVILLYKLSVDNVETPN